MRFDLFVPGASWLHRLDPRSKFLLVGVLLLMALLLKHLALLAGLLALTHLLLVGAGVPWSALRWLWARMAPLTFFILLLQPLFASGAGAPLLHIGPLVVTSGGVLDGISFALRANVMAFAASLLLFVTEAQALVLGLVRLGLPFEYGMTFSLALRYLPTTYGLWVNIIEAQQARGWTPERQSLLARLSAYRPVLVAVIIAALRLSQDLGLALACRGFGAPGTRSVWQDIRFTRTDTWICGAVSVAFGLFLAGRLLLGWGATTW
ncbi:MAG: energy-coupling factor transporter transmembrane component T [Anaerolineae bacterium]|uniref:energy-coupling factor transporter transmembrane component T family protein n=1 Tax=Candidatus Amarolinea dominans TaxID=3140696 RepID=UPI0031347F79|nr:energy-coupling factor transporter transmembrane protein EcfT [Anaerolineae bacterium]